VVALVGATVGLIVGTGVVTTDTGAFVGATVGLIVGTGVVTTDTGALVGEATAAVGAIVGATLPPPPFPIICKSAQFQNFSKSGQELGVPGQLLAKSIIKCINILKIKRSGYICNNIHSICTIR
jgi:hypothetical protein